MHDVTRATTAKMQTRTVEGRHGKFTVFDQDELVGLSLITYGEFSEGEVQVFRNVLRPGDIAIDVGANIGAFTVPMAQLVGNDGHVYAFEASEPNLELLCQNVDQNGFGRLDTGNVTVIGKAASDKTGVLRVSKQSALHAYSYRDINEGDFEVACITIDSLNLQRVKLIKIDVDGFELDVLNGAAGTIKRCQPIIYIENEIADNREAMVAWLIDHGYRFGFPTP